MPATATHTIRTWMERSRKIRSVAPKTDKFKTIGIQKMSRSYKKQRWRTGMPLGEDKWIVNSRVRNAKDVPSGGAYKKLFPPNNLGYRDSNSNACARNSGPKAYKDRIK